MKLFQQHIIFKTFLLAIAISLLFGCEKETDWEIDDVETGLIAVDGMITNKAKAHKLTLTELSNSLNGTSTPIIEANVTISDGSDTILVKESPLKNGEYFTDSTFHASKGKTYTLSIKYNNKTITASSKMRNGSENLQAFNYRYDSIRNEYRISHINQKEFNPDLALFHIVLDWSMITGYDTLDNKYNHALVKSYSLNSVDVNQIFRPDRENLSFPAGTEIVETKYSITNEHAEYLRALLFETEWKGWIFDAASSNLPTNLSEGAVGFFSVCEERSISFKIKHENADD